MYNIRGFIAASSICCLIFACLTGCERKKATDSAISQSPKIENVPISPPTVETPPIEPPPSQDNIAKIQCRLSGIIDHEYTVNFSKSTISLEGVSPWPVRITDDEVSWSSMNNSVLMSINRRTLQFIYSDIHTEEERQDAPFGHPHHA